MFVAKASLALLLPSFLATKKRLCKISKAMETCDSMQNVKMISLGPECPTS
jgi:hypothetical protein